MTLLVFLPLPASADQKAYADANTFISAWSTCFKQQGDPLLNCVMDVGFKVERYYENRRAEVERIVAARPNGAKLTEQLKNIDLPRYRNLHCDFEEEMESGIPHKRQMQQERCRFRMHMQSIFLMNILMGL